MAGWLDWVVTVAGGGDRVLWENKCDDGGCVNPGWLHIIGIGAIYLCYPSRQENEKSFRFVCTVMLTCMSQAGSFFMGIDSQGSGHSCGPVI